MDFYRPPTTEHVQYVEGMSWQTSTGDEDVKNAIRYALP